MGDLLEFIGIITFGAIAMLFVGGVVFSPVLYFDAKSCNAINANIGIETYWTFTGGCLIKTEGKWHKLDNNVQIDGVK